MSIIFTRDLKFILYINLTFVAIIVLKSLAKVKFEKTPGSKEFRELTASNWVNTTCRDIQTAVIKTCAYTNRFALKYI